MSVPSDDELLDLIAQEVLIDREKLHLEDTIEALGIDSVDIVSVLFVVEEQYGVRLEAEELSRQQTLRDLVVLVQTRAAQVA